MEIGDARPAASRRPFSSPLPPPPPHARSVRAGPRVFVRFPMLRRLLVLAIVAILFVPSFVFAWPPLQTGPEESRPVIESFTPTFGVVGAAVTIVLTGKSFTEEFGFGVLLCKFTLFQGKTITKSETIAERILDGCMPSGFKAYQCKTPRIACAAPVVNASSHMLVQVTNYDPEQTGETEHFNELRSSEWVYFSYVPRVDAFQRFVRTIENTTRIVLRGAGFNRVTPENASAPARSLVCVFAEAGVHGLFPPALNFAAAASSGATSNVTDVVLSGAVLSSLYQVVPATPIGLDAKTVTCVVPYKRTASVMRCVAARCPPPLFLS